jgi:hypothetical protein
MMGACLRTAGCPAAERNLRTAPIAGVPPSFAPWGVEAPSPFAQPHCPHAGDRAVVLKRRRLARDDILGVQGNLHSHRLGRAGGRPSIDVWCSLPTRLTPAFRRIRLHQLAERQAAPGRDQRPKIKSASGVRPLDFGDHIEVRRSQSVRLSGPGAGASSTQF